MAYRMKHLRPNLVVLLEGRPHRVELVNDCRALCIPLARKIVTIKPLVGKPVTFSRPESGLSISPTADVPVLGLLRGNTVIRPNGEQQSTASLLAQLP